MSYTCKYSKNNYEYVIELTQEEYTEVMDLKIEISDKKKGLAKLLEMFERLEPSRVYRNPKQINLDGVFNE